MNVWCRQHHQLYAVVRLHGGVRPEFVTLSPRWKAHHSAAAGHPEERANSFSNLREWGRPEVEAKGCPECGPRRSTPRVGVHARCELDEG